MLRVLWPQTRWRDNMEPELAALGTHAVPWFSPDLENVSPAQWQNCDAIVGYGQYPESIIRDLRNCRILVLPAVGFNTADLELWGSLGIPVCNTPDYGTREVADHAIALMLALSKGIAFHDERLRVDQTTNWRPALNPFGQRLATQTFGVLGLGRIGTAAALRAKAFDMSVVFYDPYQPNGIEQSLGIRRANSLDELIDQSDILSVHVPLTDETHEMIDADTLAKARQGIIIVNTARGAVINLDSLFDAMKNGTVLAAGLDVLPEEPANTSSRLIKAWAEGETWLRHRLLITPHSAFCTPQSMRDMRELPARTVMRYLRDDVLENCVNREFLTHKR